MAVRFAMRSLRRGGSRSPAICSLTKRSYGLSSLNALHDVVAVAPGVAVGDVLVHAVRVRVARDIEPVPAPALAVVRRWRAGDRPPSSNASGDLSVDESVDLLRRRRQAGQIERRAADQRALVRRRRGVQTRRPPASRA